MQHFIWSSLVNVKELSKGVLPNVYHFDSKARVEDYIRSTNLPASFVYLGVYMSFIPGQAFRPGPDGNWTLALPVPGTATPPLIDTAEDLGKFVKGILVNREKTLGKRVLAAWDYHSFDKMVEDFKELYPEAGKNAHYAQLPHDMWKGFLIGAGQSETVAQEMLENFRLIDEFGYYGKESLEFSHSVSQFT